ncbi:MAG: carboxy terminal-processing peptidase [Bacteroidia bacterium]
MKKIFILICLSLSLNLFGSDSTNIVLKTFAPETHHGLQFQLIGQLLNSFHYRKLVIDDKLSQELLSNYLENLDPAKVYFLQSDIDAFNKFKTTLDEHIKEGKADVGFEIYNIYQNRVEERVNYALLLLNQVFDFTENDSFMVNRDSAIWVKNFTEYDQLWKRKIKYELLQLKTNDRDFNSAADILRKRYQNLLKQLSKTKNEDVFSFYTNALTEIADPHTNYFSPRMAEDFNTSMSLSLEGIGATLQTDNEYTKIVSLVKGGPAERSKQINVNDRIVAVAQGKTGEMVSILDWRVDDVVGLIRGKKGTIVRLEILPFDATNSKTKIVEIVRDKIVLEDQSAKSSIKITERNGKKIKTGIISIPTFYLDWQGMQRGDANYKSTNRDVKRLIDELKKEKIDNLIIDLRNNGGGSLYEAVELTGLFIKTGPVVVVKDAFGTIKAEEDVNEKTAWDGPMAVLVNRFSASASEIFAAAMQDYGRALIIGEQTFGKGTVQNMEDLNRYMMLDDKKLGQLKITIAKFYRVSGGSTQFKGVVPDVVFPSLYADRDFGEDASKYALPYDEIKKQNYIPSGNISNVISTINKKHESRMKENAEYKYLLDDINDLKKSKSRTYKTLVADVYMQEINQAEETKKNRDAARKKLKEQTKEDADLILDEARQILLDFMVMN